MNLPGLPPCRPPIDREYCKQNEEQIAEALREAHIPREAVFITSKLSPYEMGGEKGTGAVAQILQRLGTSYVVGAGCGAPCRRAWWAQCQRL